MLNMADRDELDAATAAGQRTTQEPPVSFISTPLALSTVPGKDKTCLLKEGVKKSLNDPTSVYRKCPIKICFGALATYARGPSPGRAVMKTGRVLVT